MREVCKGPGTKKDTHFCAIKHARPSQISCTLASLFGFLAAAELARGLIQNNRMWGGGGDAPTVPSIKVSSAFVFLLRIIALYLQIHEFLR